jgi:molybdopterin converting factor subunit 1
MVNLIIPSADFSKVMFIKIQVLFFASIREMVGVDELEISLDENSTTNDLVLKLFELYPCLSSFEHSFSIAINRRVHREVVVLNAGDEVAVLPPISGG